MRLFESAPEKLQKKTIKTNKQISRQSRLYLDVFQIRWKFSTQNFLLELAMQLQKYIWILWAAEWMKCMPNLTEKFELGITLFMHIIVSFLVDKKYQYLYQHQ